MNIDTTPEPDEIVQSEEQPYIQAPIPVITCGPTEVRELPAVRAGYQTAQGVTATVAVQVLPFEPRRKYATVIALDQDIYIGVSQAAAQSGAAGSMRWPAVVPYPVGHLEEIWVCAVTGTTNVGIETAYWSE